LRAALRGLSSLPVQVIATTGKRRDPAQLGLGVIPPNARVEQWVAHSDLFPRTQVVVTTGGTGTVLKALQTGVPLVIVPTAWDQPENAWRVAEAGAGIRLPPSQCTPERLRAAVHRVLTDQSFRRNALRLAADFARYRGPGQAADLLGDLALQRSNLSRRERIELTPPFRVQAYPSANDTAPPNGPAAIDGISR
jgi:MGT family glycosyltransferase